MARFRAKLNLNSTSNKRYTDEIYFGGVDYANPRMSVQQGHALDSDNYVYREKAVQKRFGVRKDSYALDSYYFLNMGEKYVIDTEEGTGAEGHVGYATADYAIYAMWTYKNYIIVNRGGWLFYIHTLGGITNMEMTPIHSKDVESETVGSATRTIYKSIAVGSNARNAFEGNGKLYILSGKYIYVLEELDRVDGGNPHFSLCALTERGNPYIPTTTIGIVQNESAGYATRTTFEQPNLLTPKRKNGFVGGISNKRKSDTTYTYALDKEATSVDGVRMTFGSLPYSSRHTRGVMAEDVAIPLTDGIDPNTYKGFLFPRLGDDVQRNLYVNPETTGWKIDFRDFVVYAMDGTRLTYSTLDKIPPIEFQSGSSMVRYGKIVPYVNDMADMASASVTMKGMETSVSGGGTSLPGIPYTAFQKYEEGKYYVGLFGKSTVDGSGDVYSQDSSNPFSFEMDGDDNVVLNDDGLPKIKANNTTVFRVPKNSDGTYTFDSLKVKPTIASWDAKSQKATYTYGLCNCYQLLIFAKVNGEIRYGSVTFKVGRYAMLLSYTGKVDPQDYAGNIPLLSENETYRENKSVINIAVAYILGLGWTTFINEFSDLYAKAGKMMKEGSSYLAYPYHENEVNLVEADRNKIRWTETIKFNGHTLFKESPNPLTDSQIKSNQVGKYLVDKDELTSTNAVPKIYGYVIYTDGKTSSVTLYDNPKGTYDGESNIECTFTAEGEEKNKDDINKCTFGIMYGTQNSRNRLFVSGNADNPNCDWHTGSREDGVGDLDYFPADSVCAYGESTPIAGYGIVSDGKLMAVKEFSDREPSVYYRTATYSTRKDDYGKSVTDASSSAVYEESYPLTQTNSHIGALGSRLFTDFNGDALFVDTDGRIVGLDNEGTTYDNQRVANSRSQLIDPKLTECAVKDNYLVSYGNELFYFLSNGEAYYTHYDDKYEWFPFSLSRSVRHKDESEKVLCSCIFYGSMYFGTYDGAIFSFAKGSFTDTDRIKLKKGDIAVSSDDGSLVVSRNISYYMKDRAMCHLSNRNGEGTLLGLVCESSEYTADTSSKTLKFYVTEGTLQPNSTYYLNGGNKVSFEISDDMDDFRDGLDCFVIQDFKQTLDGSPLKFYVMIEPETELVLGDYYTLTATQGGRTFTQFILNGYEYYLNSYEAVSAYYVTSPYLTGSLGNRKVVDTYTIISDKGYRNEVYVKTMTNNVSMDELFDMGGQVDYSNLNYMGTDYTRYDLPHTQTLMAKFYGPFISLCITSPHAVNSVLTKINFLYHYAGKTYGKS